MSGPSVDLFGDESRERMYRRMLDSLKDPFLLCDNDHRIIYMNTAARTHYRQGADLLGTSIFDCHNPVSGEMIRQIHERMREEGLEEEMITDNSRHRIWMRAVRDDDGALVGYYERYAPPRGS